MKYDVCTVYEIIDGYEGLPLRVSVPEDLEFVRIQQADKVVILTMEEAKVISDILNKIVK